MPPEIGEILSVVEEAGELALLYSGKASRSLKADLSVVSEADAAVEGFLRLALTGLAPTYGYIGEETEDSQPPAPGETHSWVVDALDGSRAFVAGLPLWTPAVCLLDGDRPVAGAALNPVTGELFWATADGPARVGEEPLEPAFPTTLEATTLAFGPTNYHRLFDVDFPGRIYCLGAPIYQLCLVARGAVAGMFFDPAVNLWDLALPKLLLDRVGGVLVYASGRPVELAELVGRDVVPEPVFAGGPELVAALRERIRYRS
ncbi:MAG: inositol monophosphatase [Thermoleophilia bacterium]|nr:inositol monophosphatase [Thermoleophilia bacterium]